MMLEHYVITAILSIAVVVVYLSFCVTAKEERFLQAGYISVLHTTPPPASAVPVCVAGMAPELKAVIDATVPSGLVLVRGSCMNGGSVRIANALDVFQNRAEDVRVVYASSAAKAFVMLARWTSAAVQGIVPVSVIFENVGNYRFVCSSPGARWMLFMIAGSNGINTDDMSVMISPMDSLPQGVNDVICLLTAPDSSDVRQLPSSLMVVTYNTPILKELVSIKAPFLRMMGVFITTVYPQYPAKQRIVELAFADDLLVCPPVHEAKTVLKLLSSMLISRKDRAALGRNTVYAQTFNFTPASLNVIRRESVRTSEGFVDSDGTLVVLTRELEGIHEGEKVRTILTKNAIDGVPLRIGDRYKLTKQQRAAENGLYVVTKRDIHSALLSSPPTISDLSGVVLRETSGSVSIVFRNGTSHEMKRLRLRKGDAVFVVPLGVLGEVVDSSTVRLAAQGSPSRDAKYDPTAICATDRDINIKELCESGIDAFGVPKPVGVWDRPCVMDADCPFYKKNRTYDNVRGGCSDSGYCEMPMGVKQVSYRTFEGQPMCHGCDTSFRADCCDHQTLPNYAFAADTFDR